jgi:hypothetical protein
MSGTIAFTQYLRPNGQKRLVFFDCDNDEVVRKAQAIIAAGLRFECEELMTGYASLTIGDSEGDLAYQIVPNGPEVPGAVERLVMRFDLHGYRR